MTREQVLVALVELLGLTGWRVHLEVAPEGGGFPHVVAAHPSARMIAFDVHDDRALPTPDELSWLFAFRHLGTLEATIIRPDTFDAAIAWIRGIGPAPDARVPHMRELDG